MNRLALIAATAAALLLAACNSGSTPTPAPTLGPTCQLPSGVQSALVYPASGSTVTASSLTQIVIGSTAALDPTRYQIAITDALNPYPNFIVPGSSLATATPPFPSPSQTPTFANPQYQSSALSASFATNQVVTVYINDSKATNNCTPLQIGTFTTQ